MIQDFKILTLKSSASRHPLSEESLVAGIPWTMALVATKRGSSGHVFGSCLSQSESIPMSWKTNQDWGPMKSLSLFPLKSGADGRTGSSAGCSMVRSRAAIAAFSSSATRSEKSARLTCRSSRAVHCSGNFLRTLLEISASNLRTKIDIKWKVK